MKAVFCDSYGPPEVLKIGEAPKPQPKKNEVLIRVHATTVNAADCNMRGLTQVPTGLGWLARLMVGIRKPRIRIQGSVVAGVVESVGEGVKSFQPGDEVFGTGPQLGAYAEYVCRHADGALIKKPVNLSFEEAATVPYGALTALYFLQNKAHVSEGQKVLVIGASGGVGVYAVQLAKHIGATVTGVCSERNTDLVRSLGATEVIDYKKQDIKDSKQQWDIIVSVVAGGPSFRHYKHLLNPGGFYLAIAGGIGDMAQMVRSSFGGNQKVVFGGGTACEIPANLEFLKKLIEAGQLKPVVDKTFTLDQIVEAHQYAESGQKKGSIAVQIS